jgi:hypothetical protein
MMATVRGFSTIVEALLNHGASMAFEDEVIVYDSHSRNGRMIKSDFSYRKPPSQALGARSTRVSVIRFGS